MGENKIHQDRAIPSTLHHHILRNPTNPRICKEITIKVKTYKLKKSA